MKIKGWKYYNYAAIPTTPPHNNINMQPLLDKSIWKLDGKPLFARYTENFDAYQYSDWWFCIKDEPFKMEQVSSKRRYDIKKGIKLNRVEIIKSMDYISEIFEIQKLCYADYPPQYRPKLDYQKLIENCQMWDSSHVVFGAFSRETNGMVGFAVVLPMVDYVDFEILKVPNQNKTNQVSSALIYEILIKMLNEKQYKYISDGERNLVHQTNFMDYLVKQFAFRYPYCDLRIKYKFPIKVIVKSLYPFRKILIRFSKFKLIYKISSILKMEEIAISSKRRR